MDWQARIETRIEAIATDLATMRGALFGANGCGGIEELRDGIQAVASDVRMVQQSVAEIVAMHREEAATWRATHAALKEDVGHIGEIARSARNGAAAAKHAIDSAPGTAAKRVLDGIVGTIKPIVIGGLFALLLWGVSAWIRAGAPVP